MQTPWQKLSPEKLAELKIPSYDGEIILHDSDTPFNTQDGEFYFNAQQFFDEKVLEKMPTL